MRRSPVLSVESDRLIFPLACGVVMSSVVSTKEVYKFASTMIGDEKKARSWMRKPNVALGGETPLQLIQTESGTSRVKQLLITIAFGGVV